MQLTSGYNVASGRDLYEACKESGTNTWCGLSPARGHYPPVHNE